MIVAVVCATFLAVLFIWGFFRSKRVGGERSATLKAFKTDPHYERELAVFYKLKKAKFTSENMVREGAEQNRKLAAQLIKDGAELVLGMDLVSPWENFQVVYVVMPHAAFKVNSLKNGGSDYGLNLKFQNEFSVRSRPWATSSTTTTKNASVVGQAVVGGALAGGAGAVVGAVNAASKNSSGGKTTTTHNFESMYRIAYGERAHPVDSIFISTDLFEKFGQPPEKYVIKKAKNYWHLSYQIDSFNKYSDLMLDKDRKGLDKLFSYIDKIYQDHAATAKHKYNYDHFTAKDFA